MQTITVEIKVYVDDTDSIEDDANLLKEEFEYFLAEGLLPADTLVADWTVKTETKG